MKLITFFLLILLSFNISLKAHSNDKIESSIYDRNNLRDGSSGLKYRLNNTNLYNILKRGDDSTDIYYKVRGKEEYP